MENSIGLRIRVAARIMAGVILGSIGGLFLGVPGENFTTLLAGIVFWIVCTFAGLVVALEGLIKLIEEVVEIHV